MPDDPILAAKRDEAAKAMSASVPVPPGVAVEATKNSMAVAEMRLRAQIAMEGEERKKRREEAIRKERETAEMTRQEEERKKREQFEQEKIQREKMDQASRSLEERMKTSAMLKQQVDEIKGSGGGLKTIRTLKADQDNLIRSQNISLVGIAIKEEERRRQRQENASLSSGTNIKLLAASLALILIGFGVSLYVYQNYYAVNTSKILTPGGQIMTPQSIVFADTYRSLDMTNITVADLIDRIKNEVRNPPDLRLGAIENFVFTKKNAQGISTPVGAYDFFKIIGTEAPDSFLRTLGQEYMFGILSSAENAAFVIVTTESYDKSWAGLLEWDNKMLTKDMYQILTSLKPDSSLFTKQYEDLTIRSVDTRVLRDKDGTIRIVYAFLDSNKTIIIAGSQQAFIEALNRFNTPKPISI